MEETQEKLFIDVEKVFHEKNPALARLLPGFVIRYIKRIVHQDEINQFIRENGHLRDHDFVHACVGLMRANTEHVGLDNIPQQGGCIVAANHPLGGLDGIALMKVVGERRKDIRFFVNDILLNLKNFGSLFVGVNKHGKNPRENLRLMDEVFASDQCVLFFPAGLVSRRQQGEIRDLEWQKSFIAKAVQYNKPIIPAHIGGENSSFFYTFANLRKKVGIKSNIEMFFLPDEMFRQKDKTLTFTFGKPIMPEVFDVKQHSYGEWAQKLKNHIYELGKGNQEPFK